MSRVSPAARMGATTMGAFARFSSKAGLVVSTPAYMDGTLAGPSWEPQCYGCPPHCHCKIAYPPCCCTACAVPRAFSRPVPCFVRFGGT
eukprot:116440-Chlamydomonas_euryale.AAC.1